MGRFAFLFPLSLFPLSLFLLLLLLLLLSLSLSLSLSLIDTWAGVPAADGAPAEAARRRAAAGEAAAAAAGEGAAAGGGAALQMSRQGGRTDGGVKEDVTEDVTASSTGDVTASSTGDVTGDVTASSTGDVTGDVTGVEAGEGPDDGAGSGGNGAPPPLNTPTNGQDRAGLGVEAAQASVRGEEGAASEGVGDKPTCGPAVTSPLCLGEGRDYGGPVVTPPLSPADTPSRAVGWLASAAAAVDRERRGRGRLVGQVLGLVEALTGAGAAMRGVAGGERDEWLRRRLGAVEREMGLASGVYLPLATAGDGEGAGGYRVVVGLVPGEARPLSTLNKVLYI